MPQTKGKGFWDRLTITSEGGGGIWQQLESQAKEHPSQNHPGLNIWQSLQVQPGGMWRQVGDETIVTDGAIDGVWDEALDETLLLDNGDPNLWEILGNDVLSLPTEGIRPLWQEVGEETIVLAAPETNIWEELRNSPDFCNMKPVRQLGYALKKFTTARGEVYYILKNLRKGTYLRLEERQYFLWDLMDGENTIQDIAVAYLSEYGSLDISVLTGLLGQLEVGGFLTSQRTNIYNEIKLKASGGGLLNWLKVIGKSFVQREFPIRGIDRFFTRTYEGGVKYLYAKPIQIIFLIITLTGMSAFVFHLVSGQYSIVKGGTSSITLGIIGLYVARTIALFIHEGGHAYTCKHYGREIRKSGVMIYYGAFAFYVDSTDIWMEKRIPRIMVSWGGPYTGFILGGAASLLMLVSPWSTLNGFLYQFAFLIVIDSLLNLNPLLKWDGYYILMDWLEMPNLRKRSFTFLTSGQLFRKIARREKFSREERVFSIYSLLSMFWLISILGSMLKIYGEAIVEFFVSYVDPLWLAIGLGLLLLFLSRRKLTRLLRTLTMKFARTSSHS